MSNIPYQLPWYNGDCTQQDYDLLQFVISNDITAVKYLGNCAWLKSIIKRESDTPNICVFLVNESFKFSQITDLCNQELEKMPNNSFFYLAINKFLAIPEPQTQVDDDYDHAIFDYIKNKINQLEKGVPANLADVADLRTV